MNKKLLRKKLALMLATLKKKRKFFCEVEYLESTETQYIDTGFALTANSTLDFNFSPNEQSTLNLWLCGSYTTNSKLTGFRITNSTSLQGYIDSTSSISVSGSNVGKKYHCVMNSTNWSVNGTVGSSATQAAGRCNLTIFGWNASPNTSAVSISGKCSAKVYNFKISDNGILVRDFIPVLDWDMTPCMYDRVTEQLFYNQGTGDFVAGRQIHYVDYLESTGTQYINTGLLSTANSKVDAVFSFTSMESGAANNCAVFGGRNTQTSNTFTFFKLASTTTQSFRFDYNGQTYVGNASTLTWNNTSKYRFEYDGEKYTITNITESETISNSLSPASTFTKSPIVLFAVNTQVNNTPTIGTVGSYMSGRIYHYWYTDGTNTVDMYPAIDENGVGYMFDRVTHTIYDNAGTGQFSYPAREVEYLESTGTQYIDTGKAFVSSTDEIELKYQNTSTINHKWLFGSYESNANIGISCGTISVPTFWYKGSINSTESAQYNSKHILKYDSTGMSNDGINLKAFTSYTGTWNLYLFALNNTGTSPNGYFGYGKIWGYKHTRNGSMLLDLIPAFKDGQSGMWDKANEVFYSNAGTGDFAVGRITESEYE